MIISNTCSYVWMSLVFPLVAVDALYHYLYHPIAAEASWLVELVL